jgi:uncharacterized membrane protein
MLISFFRWADHTWMSEAIRGSTWAFALIEVFHLFGLTLLLGMVVLINLRLLGAGLTSRPIKDVAADAMPWTILGAVLTMGSGTLLFVAEAMKCYASGPFFIKMGLLFAALLFTFVFQRRMMRKDESTPLSKAAALLSIALWFGVGLAGRAIAFF